MILTFRHHDIRQEPTRPHLKTRVRVEDGRREDDPTPQTPPANTAEEPLFAGDSSGQMTWPRVGRRRMLVTAERTACLDWAPCLDLPYGGRACAWHP